MFECFKHSNFKLHLKSGDFSPSLCYCLVYAIIIFSLEYYINLLTGSFISTLNALWLVQLLKRESNHVTSLRRSSTAIHFTQAKSPNLEPGPQDSVIHHLPTSAFSSPLYYPPCSLHLFHWTLFSSLNVSHWIIEASIVVTSEGKLSRIGETRKIWRMIKLFSINLGGDNMSVYIR